MGPLGTGAVGVLTGTTIAVERMIETGLVGTPAEAPADEGTEGPFDAGGAPD